MPPVFDTRLRAPAESALQGFFTPSEAILAISGFFGIHSSGQMYIFADSRGMAYRHKRKKDLSKLTGDDVAALMQAAQHPETPRTFCGVRNRALVALLYRSGLRVSEALDLTPNDVFKRDGDVWLNVRHGKGGKPREVMLLNGAVEELSLWLDLRKEKALGDECPIFCTVAAEKAGKPLSRIYVANMLRRLAGEAGITKRVHAHAFRHAYASELFHRATSVATIQDQLGHTEPMTTFIYLRSIGCSDAHRELATLNR